MDQVIEDPLDEITAIAEDLEYLDKRLDADDFKNVADVRARAAEIDEQLDGASGALEDIVDALEDVDPEKLTPEQRDCISLLTDAAEEADLTIQEMDEWQARPLVIGEFEANYDQAYATFDLAGETYGLAIQQHNEDQYSTARSTAQTAVDQLTQARGYLDNCKRLEPNADLSYPYNSINTAVRAVAALQGTCDAILAGDYDTHNAKIDEANMEAEASSSHLNFDYNAFFLKETGEARASLDKRLGALADLVEEAEDMQSSTKKN